MRVSISHFYEFQTSIFLLILTASFFIFTIVVIRCTIYGFIVCTFMICLWCFFFNRRLHDTFVGIWTFLSWLANDTVPCVEQKKIFFSFCYCFVHIFLHFFHYYFASKINSIEGKQISSDFKTKSFSEVSAFFHISRNERRNKSLSCDLWGKEIQIHQLVSLILCEYIFDCFWIFFENFFI